MIDMLTPIQRFPTNEAGIDILHGRPEDHYHPDRDPFHFRPF